MLLLHNSKQQQPVLLTSQVVLAELDASVSIEALVGPSCEVPVTVCGVTTTALLDSGSQVTVISESFYKQYLGNIELQELDFDLSVTGAGGQNVPYLGAISINCELPDNILGTKQPVRVAALVCRDTSFSSRTPVIIGTNVFKTVKKSTVDWQNIRCEAAFVLNSQSGNNEGRLGAVRMKGGEGVVPANSVVTFKGIAKLPPRAVSTMTSVLIQDPSDSLPKGLGVVAAKVSVGELYNLRVDICNFSDQEIVLKPKTVIADVYTIHSEYDVSALLSVLHDSTEKKECGGDKSVNVHMLNATQGQMPNGSASDLKFKFGENTTPEWRENFTGRGLT